MYYQGSKGSTDEGYEYDFIHPIDMQKYFSLLTGTGGKRMKQWASLCLTLPAGDDAGDGYIGNALDDNIWEVLSGPTPNLKLLEIHGLEGINTIQAKKRVLPDLSGLRHLRLDSTIKLPSLRTANLDILEIPINWKRKDWPRLCRLSSLRSLKLRGEYGIRSDHSQDPEWPVLHLPNLRSIIFDGNFIQFARARFDLPSLKHVSFKHPNSIDIAVWPVLRPETVELVPTFWGNHEELIKRILLQYACTQSLEISASHEKACRDVIAQLKEDPSWSSSLKQVHFKSEEGGVNIVDFASM